MPEVRLLTFFFTLLCVQLYFKALLIIHEPGLSR